MNAWNTKKVFNDIVKTMWHSHAVTSNDERKIGKVNKKI